MPLFRIYRMKDSPRQHFKWAPHVSGCASLKLKDYELRGEVEAQHEYDAWRKLRESGEPLAVGDLLETLPTNGPGQLRICKYVGFEPAEWILPEPAARVPQPDAEAAAQAVGPAAS
jgi:hypothetical protein